MIKQIPFVAFPRSEQDAVLAALRQAGVAPRGVCVSRVEWDYTAESLAGGAFTVVTGPGLCRTYPDVGPDWITSLARDLAQPSTLQN